MTAHHFLIAVCCLIFSLPEALAQSQGVPRTIDFQATLVNENGTTFSCQGGCTFVFRLFEEETGGSPLWQETQGPINVRNGLLSVKLGRNTSLADLDFESVYWLEVEPQGTILSPRLELSAVPYSLTARRVERGAVDRESIREGAVDRDRIAPGAVDRDRIAPGAVDRDRIAPGAVDRERIQPGAVNRERLAERAVGRDQIDTGAVGRQNLEDRAVGRDQIADRAVGRQQISADEDAEPGSVLAFDGEEVRWMPPGAPAPGSVTEASIAGGAVTRDKIAQNAVDRERLAPGAVSQDRLANQAVGRQQLEPGAVGRQQIEARGVGREQLEIGAVGPEEIADGSVTPAKLSYDGASEGNVLTFDGTTGSWAPPPAAGPGSITTEMLADDAVTGAKIAVGAVDAERIANAAVTSDKIATGAVDRSQIAAGAIGREQIEPGAVSRAEISPDGAAPGQVLSFDGAEVVWAPPGDIADGSIITSMLADDAVTEDKLAEAAVATSRLADAAVTGAKLADGAVDSAKIADGAVGSAQLADGSVSTSRLADAAVTPAKINTEDAEAGDVLMLVDGSLVWAQLPGAEGLLLPYVGEAVGLPAAFEARNVGGEAIVGRAGPGIDTYRVVGIQGEAINPTWYEGVISDPVEAVGVRGRVLGLGSFTETRVGLWGQSSNYAIEEVFPSTPGSYGVVGEGSDVGVLGYTTDGIGVRGEGPEVGVDGEAGQFGVRGYGTGNAQVSAGVAGFGDHYGVLGLPNTTYVLEEVLSGPEHARLVSSSAGIVGIRGFNAADGIAGLFLGRVEVDGNLWVQGHVSKQGGSFRIDHPLDPANKWLYHSFVESPDMMNVYNGNVELDASGEAVVDLPHYFESLNRDFRYQLTAIGAPGPNLYVAEEISGNQFRIRGGTPGARVSWQVTGIRQDAWAEQNRIEVEVMKTPDDQGSYYGQD